MPCHVLHLGDAAADAGEIVQQKHDAVDGDWKVKAPEQSIDHHQEPVKLAAVADAQKQQVKEPIIKQDGENAAGEHKDTVHLNPAQDEPKQEKQPLPVAVHVDGDSQRDLGARGVPLRQHQPEPTNEKQDLHSEDIAKEEERVRQRLAQLEAEKEHLEKERLEKERLEQERLEKERLEKEMLENKRLTKERLEKERLGKERLENERLEKERLEKERLENKRLAKERLEKERLEEERLERERLEAERLKGEKDKLDQEIDKQAEKEQKLMEQKEKLLQLQQIIDSRDNNQNEAIDKEQQAPQPQKKGGRDLKENLDPQKEKKSREEGGIDLRRRRRALGAEERRVPGLEPLLELGGANLHAALEAQLLAGAVVHSRQIKQTPHEHNTDE